MRLGLYVNKNKKNLDSALKILLDIFSSASDKIIFLNASDYIENHFGSKYESVGGNQDYDYDILVAIGGDGTIMSAIRSQYHLNKPIIGVHVGHLGFLAECDLDNCHEVLIQIKNNKYTTQERSICNITVEDSDKKKDYICVNDIVVDRGESARIMKADIHDHETLVNSYEGDGLIISTANGSTGYSLSAGGPIISPNLDLLTITPICSHSLTTRTIVLSKNSNLIISFPDKKDTRTLTIDGQISLNLSDTMKIHVNIPKEKIEFILTDKSNYYQKLRNKMGWYSSKK